MQLVSKGNFHDCTLQNKKSSVFRLVYVESYSSLGLNQRWYE